jgi:Zn finger protein HypA/HybF involved in hydrogenase expression
MGKWIHRLVKKDKAKSLGFCLHCGEVKLINHCGILKCFNSRKEQWRKKSRNLYRNRFRNKESFKCSWCQITHEDFRFFDVDHIDSNHKNNEEGNLQLLCPNCHREKTLILWDSKRV